VGEGADQVTERNTGPWDSQEDPGLNDDTAASYAAYQTTTDDASGIETTDPEVDSIVVEIEQTREDMTSTVEAIGDRLDPANIVSGAKDAVRDATVGKVEDMTSQATDFIGDATSTVQDAGGGLLDTVRRNPVPALMVGVGLGLLWRSWSSDTSGARRSVYRTDDGWRDVDAWRGSERSRSGRPMYGDPSWGRGQGLGDRAGDVADAVGEGMDAMGERVDAAGERMGRMSDQFAGTATDYAATAGQIVSDNVLAAGVVAAAVGAAVGLLLPATDTERRVMGDAGSKVIDAAQSTASDAMSGMESEVTSEQPTTSSTIS
jgi:ElaB/YqjD/DUF883 family membrane-anchored ribosome-binding protein